MLNIKGSEVELHPVLQTTLQEFRRVQVSRFPIDVYRRAENKLVFFDSRFTNQKPIAIVNVEKDDKGSDLFVVNSRLIVNERFVRNNERKHKKQTKDPKKLFRYMRDYIRPFTAKEIAGGSVLFRQEQLDIWKSQARSLMRDLCNLDRADVMEEMIRMQAVGYKPQTEKFAKVMEQGLAAWQESQQREKRSVMQVHVFINPDESVEIFCHDKVGFGGINEGTSAFNSLTDTPSCIQQQVAMLRMVEDKQFVPNVGTKLDANNYWVEVFPE